MLLILVLGLPAISQDIPKAEEQADINKIIYDLSRCVAYIGIRDESMGGFAPQGTAFFYVGEDATIYLITAKHVVAAEGKQPTIWADQQLLLAYRGGKEENILVPISHLKQKYSTEWIEHSDMSVDLALLPLPTNIILQENIARVWPLVVSYKFSEVHELLEAFTISFEPSLFDPLNPMYPTYRNGYIAQKRHNRTLVFDGMQYPGNSGSPVFSKAHLIMDTDIRRVRERFIGVVSSYIPYVDQAISPQTKRVRVTFEENTGLAIIHPVDVILEIIEQDDCKSMVSKFPKLKLKE